jgi:hypothetical protein
VQKITRRQENALMIQTYFEYAPKCLRASVRAAEENMQRCVICSAFFLGPAFSFRAVYDSFFRSISKNGKILPYKNDDYIFFLRYCSETYLFEVLRSLKKAAVRDLLLRQLLQYMEFILRV